jgi:4-diphosphocytidyl-2-C-methyl-D-erythritol kinase
MFLRWPRPDTFRETPLMPTLLAPVKLTLYLAVGATRPDGFHSLTAVFCALDEGDAVSVDPAPRLSLRCEPPVGVPDEENLAWRAAVAMGEAFGRSPDVAVGVVKRVMAGAGLGGGSGDAAAVIAAIAALWGADRDDPRLEAVARDLGADVAFLLRGGCAVYGGRGDVFKRALPLPPVHFAVASPGAPVPTGAAYAAFDAGARAGAPGPRAVTDAICLRDPAALGAALFNNMDAAALGLVPAIGDALTAMRATAGCLGASLAGSGSAVFGVFADAAAADAAVSGMSSRGWWSFAARLRHSVVAAARADARRRSAVPGRPPVGAGRSSRVCREAPRSGEDMEAGGAARVRGSRMRTFGTNGGATWMSRR